MNRTAATVTALGAAVLVLAAVLVGWGSDEQGRPGPQDTSGSQAPATPPDGAAPQAGATPSGAPTAAPTETLEQQVQRVARTVADLRGHAFRDPPDVAVRDAEQVTAAISEQLQDVDAAELDRDTRLLVALRAVAAGTDLLALVEAALTEQVAGYYDPETGELVVRATPDGRRLGRLDELTLAHELDHALTDQLLGLPDVEALSEADPDAATAQQALVEGDATLLMQQYAQAAFTAADQLLLAGELAEAAGATEALDAMPWILQRGLLFPYQEGAAFVAALHAEAGWPGVDRAYRELPTDTGQVLFPQRYLAGIVAGTPAPVGTPGAAWRSLGTITIGAADLLALFEAPGDRRDAALEDPRAEVAGWNGGIAEVFADGARSAVGLSLLDTGGLCDAMQRWYAAAAPDAERRRAEGAVTFDGADQDVVLSCPEGRVRVGIAPELATATRLAALQR